MVELPLWTLQPRYLADVIVSHIHVAVICISLSQGAISLLAALEDAPISGKAPAAAPAATMTAA